MRAGPRPKRPRPSGNPGDEPKHERILGHAPRQHHVGFAGLRLPDNTDPPMDNPTRRAELVQPVIRSDFADTAYGPPP